MGESVILKKIFFCIFVDIVAVIAVVPIPIIGAEKRIRGIKFNGGIIALNNIKHCVKSTLVETFQ